MRRSLLPLVGIAFCFAGTASAQSFSLFRVQAKTPAQLEAIANDFEIVSRSGELYEVYVPVEKAQKFKVVVPQAELLKVDVDAEWREHWGEEKSFATGYHDWQSVQDYMTNAVAAYPKLVTMHAYGESKQGYPLSYLRLSTGPGKDGAKPKIWLDAATHGDELISTEVLLSLVDELLKGYGSDERLTTMLDKTDIYLSFVVNPDGYVKQQRYDNGVDPNRSYPWPGDPNHKATASIQALMDLFAAEKFTGSISFHAYGRLLMYPWGYTTTPIADETDRNTFSDLCDKLAAENGYSHGPISTTIYIAKGSSADYNYWKFKTQALAVELTNNKVPSASKIPAVVNEAREMVWGFIEHYYL